MLSVLGFRATKLWKHWLIRNQCGRRAGGLTYNYIPTGEMDEKRAFLTVSNRILRERLWHEHIYYSCAWCSMKAGKAFTWHKSVGNQASLVCCSVNICLFQPSYQCRHCTLIYFLQFHTCESEILAFGPQLTRDASKVNKPDTIIELFLTLWPISSLEHLKKKKGKMKKDQKVASF